MTRQMFVFWQIGATTSGTIRDFTMKNLWYNHVHAVQSGSLVQSADEVLNVCGGIVYARLSRVLLDFLTPLACSAWKNRGAGDRRTRDVASALDQRLRRWSNAEATSRV